jgi:RNase P subunit RPR2
MARGKRGRPRAAALRRQRASAASERLSKILEKPWSHSEQTVNQAASQLWSIGRRHRIGLPSNQRIWICRGCKAPLRPGVTARVRIRQRRRITSCNSCGRISRRGPDFPREVDE